MRDFCIALIAFSCILISAAEGNTKLLIEIAGSNSSTVDIEDFARKAIAYANITAVNITVDDINECESLTLNTCSEDAECVNTDGSFTCGCNPGFLDENEANPGRNCTDIDECLEVTHECTGNTTCQNTPGNYTCACENGFSRDGATCVDVDECSTNQHNCSQNAVCSNVVASFTCTCKNGYSGDGYSCTEIVITTQQTATTTTTPIAVTTPTESSTTIATGITLALTTNIPLNVTSFTTTEETTTSSTPPSTTNSEQSVDQTTVAESTSQAPSLIISTSEVSETTEGNEVISVAVNTTLVGSSDSTVTEAITIESLSTDSVQVGTTRETSTDDNNASVSTDLIETATTDGSDLPITQTMPSETMESETSKAITTESNQATTENQDTLTFAAVTTSTGQEITTSEQTTSEVHQNTPEAATPMVQTTIDDSTKMEVTTEALVMSTLELGTGQAAVETSRSGSVTADSGSETTAVSSSPETEETSAESLAATTERVTNLSSTETTKKVFSATAGISITESVAIATSDTDTIATTQLPEVDTAPSPTSQSAVNTVSDDVSSSTVTFVPSDPTSEAATNDTFSSTGVDAAQTVSLKTELPSSTSQEVTTSTGDDQGTTFSVEAYTPYASSASSSTYTTTEKQDNLEENTKNSIISSTSSQNFSSAATTAESKSTLSISSVSSNITQEEMTIMATTQTVTNSTNAADTTSESKDTATETTRSDTTPSDDFTTQTDAIDSSSFAETVTQSSGIDKSEAGTTSVDDVTTAADIVTTATIDQQTTTTNAVSSTTSKRTTAESVSLEFQTTVASTQKSTTTTQMASTPSIPTTQALTSKSPTTLEVTTSTISTTQSTVATTTSQAATTIMLDTTASHSTGAPNVTAGVSISTSTNKIVDITTQSDVDGTTLQQSTKATIGLVTVTELSTTNGSTSSSTTFGDDVSDGSTSTMLVSTAEKSTTTPQSTISSAQTSVETTTGNYTFLPEFNGDFKKYIDDLERIFENEAEVKLKFDEAETVIEIFEQAFESDTASDEKIANTLFDTVDGFAHTATGEDGVIDPVVAARMTAFVTTMLEEIDLPTGPYRNDKDTLVVEARDVNKSDLPAEIDFKPGDSTDRTISLPNAFIQSSSEDESATLRFAFTEYSDGRLFLARNSKVVMADATYTADDFESGARIVNTAVIGASIANIDINNSSERVTVKMKAILSEPLRTGNDNGTVEIVSFTANPKCVWWDYDTLSWSENGCELTNNADGAMTCKCNHLTSFAVLMSVEKTVDDPVLTYLSFIGSGLSIVGLLWTILTFSIFSSLRKSRSKKILLHFCGALCGVYIAYVFGIAAKLPVDQAQCIVSGFFLHFLTLSVMAWMSLEVFDMYFMFVKVMWNPFHKYMLKAGLIAWLTPFVVALVTLGAHLGLPDKDIYPIYQEGTTCWLGKVGMLYAFIIPSCILLFTNLILFAIVLYHVTFKRNHSALNRLGKKSSKKVKAGQHIINALALLLLAGPTWIIGYFINIEPVEDGVFRRTLSYVFVLLNAFQGFWIFIVFSVRPAPVRKRWVILITKGKLSDSTSFSSTSGSRHTTRTLKSPRPSLFPPSQEVCARSDCSSLSSAGGKRVVQAKLSNNSNNSNLSSSKSSTKSSTAPLTAYAGKTTTKNLERPALTAEENKAYEDTEKNNSRDRKQDLDKVSVADSVKVDDKGGRKTEKVDGVVASENPYSFDVEVNCIEKNSSHINHSEPVHLPQNIEPYDPPDT